MLRRDEPLRLASFWATALGWQIEEEPDGEVCLVPTDGTRFELSFFPVPESKTGKNRLHLDLTTTSVDDQEETVERLVELGARHIDIGQRPDEGHVVLADPEGNEFCVIAPNNNFLAGCERLGSITCDGTREVGYFWSAALGWPLVWDQDEETAIRAPDGTGPLITWGLPVPPKIAKNRLHLDVAPPAHGDQQAEVAAAVPVEFVAAVLELPVAAPASPAAPTARPVAIAAVAIHERPRFDGAFASSVSMFVSMISSFIGPRLSG